MVKKDEAFKYLSDAAPETSFWVNNGAVLKNLEELHSAIPEMPEDTFSHHVSREKNDFSRWIDEVIGDKKLAKDISSSRNKESLAKKLGSRLALLRKYKG